MKIERLFEWILSVPIILSLWGAVVWLSHIDMVKHSDRVKYLKKATYSEIKEKMSSTVWDFDQIFPDSLFGIDGKAYFHASIFEFNRVGYLLTPYGYIMASLFQKKIRKQFGYYKKPYVN